jgi:hypothetical protein
MVIVLLHEVCQPVCDGTSGYLRREPMWFSMASCVDFVICVRTSDIPLGNL